jgi:cytochrome c-type biogenesis protein CcmH
MIPAGLISSSILARSTGAVIISAMLIAMFLFVAGGSSAFAQTATPAEEPPLRAVTADEVNEVARGIWCPLCSGVRLDACELKACEQMKDVIAIKLAEGEDAESIKAYFVDQYGPQVLGEPPRQGFNWLAWILPVVAVIGGGYFFWRTTQRMMKPAGPLEADPTPVALMERRPNAAQSTGAKANAARTADEDDEYTQKLEEELAKYG